MRISAPILETARLQLRPLVLTDVDDLHQFWTAPEVRKYLWDDKVIARQQVIEVVDSSQQSFVTNGFGHWAITFKGETELLGWSGLRHFGEPPKVEVLYGLRPQFWGQGLALEATLAILKFGFDTLGLACIYAGADPPNIASIRVMEKAGMRFDQYTQVNGIAAIYYVLAREEFPSALHADTL
jgi:[ribosomal protein S5]-alanine N-acetyltransferase